MILGIDTSAYTSSIAIIDSKQNLVLDKRILLDVAKGERGLRQSEAVFQHIKNLEKLSKFIKSYNIRAIGVSNKPVNNKNSYMPVFKVGETIAEFSAKCGNIPVYYSSHQEGHIAAGLWSQDLKEKKILAIHISGGTTDFLSVLIKNSGYKIQRLARSDDLHAGQFIDRVGVALGSEFPAGNTMDQWANKLEDVSLRIASSVTDNNISFSGPETAAQRLIKQKYPKEEIAYAVFISIARSLEKVIRNIYQKNKYDIILFVGGVARNSIIKNELKTRLLYKLSFCVDKYSSDNAVGAAILAQKKHFKL